MAEQDEKVGGIYFDVDLEIDKLLGQSEKVDQALDQIGGQMDRLDRRTQRVERSMATASGTMTKLTSIAQGLIAALSVQQITEYGNAWVTVNNKLANSIRETETLADVTERVFNISQQTRTELNATASLYSRLESATKGAGVSTQDLITLTSTINKGLAVSGATAAETASTVTQLSQALASGVLRGEEFNSLTENGSRLARALAESLGVTIGQLRAMAAEGELTADVVVKGLLSQSDVIGKEFTNTITTMGQAFTVATNNVTKFVGESSLVTSAINTFNSGIIGASENLDVISKSVAALAALVGGRFVAALTLAGAEKLKGVLASQAAANADRQEAQAAALVATGNLRAAAAAKARALDELRLAELMKQTAVSANMLAVAEAKLSAARVAAATAVDNYNRALAANKAAQITAGTASKGLLSATGLLSGAFRLLGGPVGVAFLAGSAIAYFAQQSAEARREANDTADSLDRFAASFSNLTKAQQAAGIANLRSQLPELKEAYEEQAETVKQLEYRIADYNREIQRFGTNTTRGRQAAEALAVTQDKLAQATAELETRERRLSQTQSAIVLSQAEMNGELRQGIDLLQREGEQLSVAGNFANYFAKQLNAGAEAKARFNATQLMIPRSEDAEKYLENLRSENELLAIQDERLRAVARARQEAEARGGNVNQINQAGDEAGRAFDLSAANARAVENEREHSAALDQSANAAERVAQKLERLREQSELTADSTKELSREQAILKAQQSLGNTATQEQIRLAGEYAAKIWEQTNALKARKEVERGQAFAKGVIAEAATEVDPVTGEPLNANAKIDLEEEQKLARLQELQAQDLENFQLYEDAKTAIAQTASAARAQLAEEERRNEAALTQQALSSISSGLSTLTTAIGQAAGKNSGAYKAMFALSKGFAIAQAGINVSLAVSQALADPTTLSPAQKFANWAAVASAGASLIGSIVSATYSPGREHGGPVNAGSMYQVGEKGKPEIFQANNGKQYMIPGDNGKVISNKDMMAGGSGMGGISVTVNYDITTTNGIDAQTQKQLAQQTEAIVLKTIKNQQRPAGLLARR